MSFMLGSIRATLGLDETNFVRGMINAETSAQIFGQSVVNFVNNPLLGTVNLLKNVGLGIFDAVKQQAFANQELLRSADRIGTTVELLSALRGAYKGWGQDADSAQRQLTKLTQQVGEANSGNAQAVANFEAIGVSLRDSAGHAREFNDIFFDVVEGLGNLEDHSRRVAIAQKLFGEDVSRTIDIVGRGRRVLEEFRDEADKLGEVFSREQADQANALANAFDTMDRAIKGIKTQLAQGVITGFVGEDFNSTEISNLAKTMRDELAPAAQALGEGLRFVVEQLKKIKDEGLVDVLVDLITRGVAALGSEAVRRSLGPIPRGGQIPGVPDNSGMTSDDIDSMLSQSRGPRGLRWVWGTRPLPPSGGPSGLILSPPADLDAEDLLWWMRVQEDRRRRARATQ